MAVTVAGAGMAGLVAAVRLREQGRDVVVVEKGPRAGGSLLLSSGVIWRHRSLDEFHAACPGGDLTLQRAIVDRLDDALDWLGALVAPVANETGNQRTLGARFDPAQLVSALARQADVRLGDPLAALPGPTVLATGGYAASLARERGLLLRAAPWSTGDGIALGRDAGAAERGDPAEFYGRVLPAPPARVGESDFVRAAQLYGAVAHVVDSNGSPLLTADPAWHEVDIAWAVARSGVAWFVVDAGDLAATVRGRSVEEMIAVAEELGGEVRRAAALDALGLGPLRSPKLAEPPFAAVKVATGVTHTYAGLAVDGNARVLGHDGLPLPGLWACGVDAGGIFSGGYASGLAAALVLGRAAAESAAAAD
jgi:succinate dehydrogenase/fumarate reductase flavoprotein subunit